MFGDVAEVDPERLFRVLEFMAVLEAPGKASRADEALDMVPLVQTWHPDVAAYLAASRHLVSGGAAQRVLEQLWRELKNILSMKEPPANPRFQYLADLVSSMRGQTIVTLNYDDTIERMPGRAYTFRVDSSPEPHETDLHSIPWQNRPLRLIKLHGSLEWRESKTTGVVEESVGASFWTNDAYWYDYRPATIFGAGNKLRPTGPYLDLYQEFKTAVAAARQVIVIGYSFRDTHVNEVLRHWLTKKSQRGDLLRINTLDGQVPSLVRSWPIDGRIDLQVVGGPAETVMHDLIAPVPPITRRQ